LTAESVASAVEWILFCRIELTPLDVAACYADYHVYNAVNTKLQSLPPEKDKDKKKKQNKKIPVKPRPGADLYQRKIAGASMSQTAKVCTTIHYACCPA